MSSFLSKYPNVVNYTLTLHSLHGLLPEVAKGCVRSVNIWCLDSCRQRDMVMANHSFGELTFMSYRHRLLGHGML
jgi:hypothetical protein